MEESAGVEYLVVFIVLLVAFAGIVTHTFDVFTNREKAWDAYIENNVLRKYDEAGFGGWRLKRKCAWALLSLLSSAALFYFFFLLMENLDFSRF